MQAYDVPLHDIKPLMEIHDPTPIILGIASVSVLLLLLIVGYLLVKRVFISKRHSRRRHCFAQLEALELDSGKEAAYAISRLGRCFAGDSPRLREAYENLYARLEPYKFKKRVPPIDEETRAYFRIFLGMIDV